MPGCVTSLPRLLIAIGDTEFPVRLDATVSPSPRRPFPSDFAAYKTVAV